MLMNQWNYQPKNTKIALYYELLRVPSELLTNARKYILKVADLTEIPTVDVSFMKLALQGYKTLGKSLVYLHGLGAIV